MAKVEGPIKLDNLISNLVVSKSWQSRMRLHQVFTFWDDVVGVDIARRAQPQVIRGTVLWVGVCDSIWMQQLQYERQYLLEAINLRLGEADSERDVLSGSGQQGSLRLTELRLTLDPSLVNKQHQNRSASLQPLVVDQEKLTEFTRMLSSIADQELKQSMIRVWLIMHQKR